MKILRTHLATVAIVALTGIAVPAMAGPMAGSGDFAEQLKAADRNDDGQVSRPELVDYRTTQWTRFDRNGNGYFSRDDLPRFAHARWDGEKLVRLRLVYDRDRDGRVSRQEFVDGPTPAFDAADTDRDGLVSAAELRAMAAQIRG